MSRPRAVSSPDAPQAIGPYSQAIRVGTDSPASFPRALLFLSGQIALDPRTGELVKGTIEEETEQVMRNLEAVLAAGGARFEHVVKTTIYLVDLGDFATVNAAYGRRFTSEPPARATVQVAALPRGARVEIECVAVVGG